MSNRVPMLNTTTSPTPLSQPPTQTPANMASPPSVLPLYPAVDIDAHVRHFVSHRDFQKVNISNTQSPLTCWGMWLFHTDGKQPWYSADTGMCRRTWGTGLCSNCTGSKHWAQGQKRYERNWWLVYGNGFFNFFLSINWKWEYSGILV